MSYFVPKAYRDHRADRLARNSVVAVWLAVVVGLFTAVFTLSLISWWGGWSWTATKTASGGTVIVVMLVFTARAAARRARDYEAAVELRALGAAAERRPAGPPARWDHLDVEPAPPSAGPQPVGGGLRPELALPRSRPDATQSDFTVYALRPAVNPIPSDEQHVEHVDTVSGP